MKKILFIAFHYPPQTGPGVQRAEKFVEYLPAEGFLPVVVTGPNSIKEHLNTQGPCLAKTGASEVAVHHIKGRFPALRNKFGRRVQRWLALPSPFSRWWTTAAFETSIKAGAGASLIFATMSPFESAHVASEAAKRLGIPWVADLRDPWAIDEVQVYPTIIHRRIDMLRMERVLSTAALIVMNTPAASVALRRAYPRLHNKLVMTIPNGFDRDDFSGTVQPRADSKFRIVHSGGMLTEVGLRLASRRFYRVLGGAMRGIDLVTRSPLLFLEALDRWCQRRPSIFQELEVVFAGNMSDQDHALIKGSKMAPLFSLPGYLSHEDSVQLVRTADLLFLPMHNLRPGDRALSIPGKTYEYMASGRPILAAVPDGDARDFLEKSGNAFICRPDEVEGMVRNLDIVYDAWKQKKSARVHNAEFVAEFERRNQTRALADEFRTILSSERSSDVANAAGQMKLVNT